MSRKLCSRRRSCQGNGFRFTTVVSLTKVGSRLAQTRPEQHCGWQRVSSKWKRRSGLTVLSDTYIWEKVVAYMVRLQVSPVHTCLRLFRIISDHLRIISVCMILSYFHMIFRCVAFLLYQALSAFARRRQDLERQSVRMRGEAWRLGQDDSLLASHKWSYGGP